MNGRLLLNLLLLACLVYYVSLALAAPHIAGPARPHAFGVVELGHVPKPVPPAHASVKPLSGAAAATPPAAATVPPAAATPNAVTTVAPRVATDARPQGPEHRPATGSQLAPEGTAQELILL